MQAIIYIYKNKSIFKIFGFLMLTYLILSFNLQSLKNYTFGDNYRRMAYETNSFVSLTRKNSQIEEKNTIQTVKDYHKEFEWPLYGNISILMSQLERGETPSISPFKNYDHSYLIDNKNRCLSDIFGLDVLRKFFPSKWISYLSTILTHPYLLIIVKSTIQDFEQRNIIRRTWGNDSNSVKPFQTKTMFIIGYSTNSSIQDNILKENDMYNDLIQVDVIENYYNITYKTLMGLRWAYDNCFHAKYFLFIDNDYYLSVKNLLLFVWNPSKYEEYTDKHKDDATLNRTDFFYEGK